MPNSFSNVIFQMQRRLTRRTGPVYGPIPPLDPPTPIYISHLTRTVIIWAVFFLLMLFATKVPNIVQILVIGATVALVMSFPVGFLKKFMPKALAITIVTIGLLATIILSVALLVPFLINEITRLVAALPGMVERASSTVLRVLESLHERGWMNERPEIVLDDLQSSVLGSGEAILSTMLGNVVTTLSTSFNLFIMAFGVTFVSVYLLIDIPNFKDAFIRLWTPPYRRDAYVLWDMIGFSLSRYLGGLGISLALQGVMAWIGLTLLGVPYALILGLVVSATAILPYIGAWISAVPALLIAATISWQMMVAVGLLYVLINQVEGNLITPRIQGNAVRVHPLLIFIGVLAGSRLFGAIGAVMAVPTIAILRVVCEFFWLRLQVSADKPTVLSAMRFDSVDERIVNQSPIAEIIEDNADRVSQEQIDRATNDHLREDA